MLYTFEILAELGPIINLCELSDRLYAAGCSDATSMVHGDMLRLRFQRERANETMAWKSAMSDVKGAQLGLDNVRINSDDVWKVF